MAVADQTDPRLDLLFENLHASTGGIEASQIEQVIWQVWLQTGQDELDRMVSEGIREMNTGNFPVALILFNGVVEAAPEFAEGWNKRATLYWLMGDFDASVDDIDRTLALEPRHFGALSGLAMIRENQGRPAEALRALEKAAAAHPHLPQVEMRIRRLQEHLGEPI